jgi:hypothetical protein
MNRCPNCAAQNRDGAKFCTSCGFRMPAPEAAAAKAPAAASSGRSPFATTSTLGRPAETATATVPESYEGWTTPIEPQPEIEMGPGGSWDSPPPVDTAVPVSDEMIASLISAKGTPVQETDQVVAEETTAEMAEETEPAAAAEAVEPAEPADEVIALGEPEEESVPVAEAVADVPEVEPFVAEEVAPVAAITTNPVPVSGDASVDSLLKLVRELEYGLVELADSRPAASDDEGADVGLLAGALQGLSSEDEVAILRDAISTAQDRPRDVDVMLDLVLRADAIAIIIGERDQLKSAIELALRSNGDDSSED